VAGKAEPASTVGIGRNGAQLKILHIAPHLGGGVGRFLSNIVHADSLNQHEFCLLEAPIDKHLLSGIAWRLFVDIQDRFERYVDGFDIVQIEFWNHPLLFKLLMRQPIPDCRLAVYSHVSGIYAPNIIPQVLFDFADTVVLSTPAAKERYAAHIQEGKCRIIHGIGGINRTAGVQRTAHNGINIAYIGTASHSKLHPGFVQACGAVLKHSPEAHFIVASNDDNGHLRAEADELGIGARFEFLYQAKDVGAILSRSDLFGYPMRPDHFGSGEQAILETMGAGVAPVVIGNPAEMSLLEDGVTGFVANDIYDYAWTIRYCIKHPGFAGKIGRQAKEFALENYTLERTMSKFAALYSELMNRPKTERQFCGLVSSGRLHPGWALFKLCLGNHPDIAGYENAKDEKTARYFRDKIMRSPYLVNENKGGMKMYLKHFPDDPQLNRFLFDHDVREDDLDQ